MPFFTSQIIDWYNINHRKLPWRETSNPYFVWLSEVILQQTQVKQGLPYYLKFIDAFPTVYDLANANQQDVLNLWQGLGYYSRARNLHQAAKTVAEKYNGDFPDEYKALLKLKGVGPYTAAAIASISFGKKHAVVDGNVYRVLSRYFDIDTPINSTAGMRKFQELASELLPNKNVSEYNQGIMELGALVCTPSSPKCTDCPVVDNCLGYQRSNQHERPVKIKKGKKKERYFNYICIDDGNCTILKKRTENDIWKEMYEFPMVESDKLMDQSGVMEKFATYVKRGSNHIKTFDEVHILTHQKIHARCYYISIDKVKSRDKIAWSEINSVPIPRLIEKFIIKLKE